MPANCTHGYTPTGTCQPCPTGQTQLAAFGTACVPAECDYGYTSTGACEAASPTPRYSTLKCTTYSANASAREYLDAYTSRHTSKLDQAICPPQGLFLASQNNEEWPKWGFQRTVAKYYGKVVMKELGECSWMKDTGLSYDFQIPCKAHDYCYDLRRTGLSGTVLDKGCDGMISKMAAADCIDRSSLAQLGCSLQIGKIDTAMESRFGYANPNPGPVNFVNVKTGKCVTVKNSSAADNADVVQSSCVNSENQRFRLHPATGSAGYFQIKPAHVTGQNMCVAVVVASLKQKSCSSSSQAQTFGLDSVSGDTWAVKRKNLSRSCWTVPYTDSSGRAITPGDSTALVNVLCTAASRSNQVWRIQKAASRVLSTRIRTTTTTTPPTTPTTAPPPTTAAPPVPGAPSGLTAAAAAGSVALSWNNPSDSTITRYEVRVRPAAVTDW